MYSGQVLWLFIQQQIDSISLLGMLMKVKVWSMLLQGDQSEAAIINKICLISHGHIPGFKMSKNWNGNVEKASPVAKHTE